MAADIVPALLEKIEKAFDATLEADPRLARIAKRIRDGTATLEDVHALSVVAGESLSGVLLEYFTPDALPGGVYYYNIVDRILGATVRENYNIINAAAQQIQAAIDEAEGIGLEAVLPPFPEDRTHGLVEKIVGDAATPTRWLGEPVVNLTESISDDYMRTNAETRARAGLEAKIVRKLGAFEIRQSKKRRYEVPCEWCQALAGEYLYDGDQPPEIFQRHENCRCSVTYRSGRLMQDTGSKRWYTDTGQALRNVKDTEPFKRTPEEAREFEQALAQEERRAEKARRERMIAEYARENDVSHRRAANRITRAERT
jgi:hypothetical protein